MSDSLLLTIIYTLGHFVIAVLCVKFITGASLELATLDALIEPAINAIWLYVLHRIYSNYIKKINSQENNAKLYNTKSYCRNWM